MCGAGRLLRHREASRVRRELLPRGRDLHGGSLRRSDRRDGVRWERDVRCQCAVCRERLRADLSCGFTDAMRGQVLRARHRMRRGGLQVSRWLPRTLRDQLLPFRCDVRGRWRLRLPSRESALR